MKPLTEYTKNGYDFVLHKKIGEWAIFIGTKPTSKSANYEVCHLRITPAGSRIVPGKIAGTTVQIDWEDHERPVGDKEWGVHGFTCLSLEEAQTKLHTLTNQTTKPNQP